MPWVKFQQPFKWKDRKAGVAIRYEAGRCYFVKGACADEAIVTDSAEMITPELASAEPAAPKPRVTKLRRKVKKEKSDAVGQVL